MYPVRIDATADDYVQYTKRKRSGQVDTSRYYYRKNVDVGYVKLRLRVCRTTKGWKIKRAFPIQSREDVYVTTRGEEITEIEPASNRNGYSVLFNKVGKASIQVQADRCTKKPRSASSKGTQALKGLLQLPWSWSKNGYAVGAFVAAQALPDAPKDKYWCSRVGSPVNLGVAFRASDGRPTIAWGSSGQVLRMTSTTYEVVCGGNTYTYCAESPRETIWMKKH